MKCLTGISRNVCLLVLLFLQVVWWLLGSNPMKIRVLLGSRLLLTVVSVCKCLSPGSHAAFFAKPRVPTHEWKALGPARVHMCTSKG